MTNGYNCSDILYCFNVFFKRKLFVFTDSETLSQLSNRLEAAEQELINAKLDEKLATINSARISQVSFKKQKIIL